MIYVTPPTVTLYLLSTHAHRPVSYTHLFRSEPAFEALKHVEKVRINPGNFLHQKASLDDETARTEIAEVFGRVAILS